MSARRGGRGGGKGIPIPPKRKAPEDASSEEDEETQVQPPKPKIPNPGLLAPVEPAALDRFVEMLCHGQYKHMLEYLCYLC